MKLEQTIFIGRTISCVFDYCSTLENAAAWRHEVLTTTLDDPAPTQVGTRGTELRQGPHGVTQEWRLEVTEFEANRLLCIASSWGAVRVDERHLFTADGGSTRYTLHLELTGATAPASGLQKRTVDAMLNLKWLLEDPARHDL